MLFDRREFVHTLGALAAGATLPAAMSARTGKVTLNMGPASEWELQTIREVEKKSDGYVTLADEPIMRLWRYRDENNLPGMLYAEFRLSDAAMDSNEQLEACSDYCTQRLNTDPMDKLVEAIAGNLTRKARQDLITHGGGNSPFGQKVYNTFVRNFTTAA